MTAADTTHLKSYLAAARGLTCSAVDTLYPLNTDAKIGLGLIVGLVLLTLGYVNRIRRLD